MNKLNLSLVCLFFTCLSAFAQQNTLPQNGNVGIGTTNPTTKLDVKGSVKIDSMLNVKDSILVHKDARIKKNLTVEKDVRFVGLGTVNNLDNKNFLIIKPNGKVEQVEKSLITEILGKEIYTPKSCNGGGDILDPTWSNGLNKIYVECPQVNVGIGTKDPLFDLDVRGTTYSSRLALGAFHSVDIPATFYLKSPLPQNLSSNLFLLENADRKIFQINNNGLVQARAVKVDVQNWPDYVFQPDYKLLSLKQTEEYINRNKHLPNIPAAENIEKEGLDLAEMNKLLIEKVEELTLHLIEQDKINQQQNEKIEALSKELKAGNHKK